MDDLAVIAIIAMNFGIHAERIGWWIEDAMKWMRRAAGLPVGGGK